MSEPQWGPTSTYRAKPRWRQGRGELPRSSADTPARERPHRPADPDQPPARSSGAPRTRRRRRVGVGTVLLLIVVLLVGYPLVLGAVGYTSVNRIGSLGDPAVAGTPGHTILMVGSDSREGTDIGGGGGARTDTIMLLHRPSGSGPTVLVSIPRDSYVEIPGHGHNKINAAYAFGGPALLARTVERATGVGVDSFVETDLARFPEIVNAVGGVRLCPKQAIDDPKAALNIPAGCQQMDGATALGYARTRKGPTGDLGRVQRQRELISAIGKEAASPKTLVNPFQAFPLASSAGHALSVDDGTGPIDLARFALAMRAVSGSGAIELTVPIGGQARKSGAGAVVLWDEAKAQQLFDAIRSNDTEAIRPLAEEQAP